MTEERKRLIESVDKLQNTIDTINKKLDPDYVSEYNKDDNIRDRIDKQNDDILKLVSKLKEKFEEKGE